jgi:hypothetical protein
VRQDTEHVREQLREIEVLMDLLPGAPAGSGTELWVADGIGLLAESVRKLAAIVRNHLGDVPHE